MSGSYRVELPSDPTPVWTRVALQHGIIEPPRMLSWPGLEYAPVVLVTCPRCGKRSPRRATHWETIRGESELSLATFHCYEPVGGCGRQFTRFNPIGGLTA